MRGLLYYLFTEGLAGEKGLESAHADARVIAGWDDTADLEGLQPPACAGGQRDFRGLVSRLNEPVLALDRDQLKKYKPVYHLTVAAAKDPDTGQLVDRYLSDEQWADIAREYMDQMGLAKRVEDTGVRWVAVRHASDHIHIVATLARQDGRRPRLFNDRYRSMEASRFLESKYGLTATSANGRTGAPSTSRAESRKHQATARRRSAEGLPAPAAPDREVLRPHVRTAAAGAGDLTEFFARLRSDGLLVRARMSERTPGEVTGYAVALPDRYDNGGKPIYFGGGKLAPDLTLPQLQRRWQDTGSAGVPSAAGKAFAPDPRAAPTGRVLPTTWVRSAAANAASAISATPMPRSPGRRRVRVGAAIAGAVRCGAADRPGRAGRPRFACREPRQMPEPRSTRPRRSLGCWTCRSCSKHLDGGLGGQTNLCCEQGQCGYVGFSLKRSG